MQPNLEALSQCVQVPDDAQLIKQFQQGERSVFDQLVRRHYHRIYQLALRFVKNPEDALDVTQDIFLQTYQALPDFKQDSQFYTWLHRITVNLCIDLLRRNAKRKIMTDESATDDFLDNAADRRLTSPSEALENKELGDYLRQAIMHLSPKQREIFLLRYWEGLSLEDIARKVGREIGTVKRHLFDARGSLQNQLRPYLQNELYHL